MIEYPISVGNENCPSCCTAAGLIAHYRFLDKGLCGYQDEAYTPCVRYGVQKITYDTGDRVITTTVAGTVQARYPDDGWATDCQASTVTSGTDPGDDSTTYSYESPRGIAAVDTTARAGLAAGITWSNLGWRPVAEDYPLSAVGWDESNSRGGVREGRLRAVSETPGRVSWLSLCIRR